MSDYTTLITVPTVEPVEVMEEYRQEAINKYGFDPQSAK